ncbi:MAG: caspase domain-containing protein, partial [Hyphomicrobiaceae bacterium]
DTQTTEGLALATATIDDNGKGVGRIEWRVNGITVAVMAKPSGPGPNYRVTQQLALDPGENTIEIVAYNAANLLASQPSSTTVKYTGPVDTVRPKLHVLAIGIDAYSDKGWTPPGETQTLAFAPLSLAAKDAITLSAALQKAGARQYADVRVTHALNADATVANLDAIIDRMAREIHPRDTFVLFAAGHGTSHNGRFYMIPVDYQGGPDPAALASRAISQDLLQDWVANRIKAKRALILLDTCESGALVGGATRSRVDVPASEAGVGRLHEATGRPVLTAAAEGEFAHEGVIGDSGILQGIFTWAIVDALKNGDRNSNGKIELSELVAHVQSEVPALAARLGGSGRSATAAPIFGHQSARFGSKGEDFALVARMQ